MPSTIRKFIQTASTEILQDYNRVAGTKHQMPNIVHYDSSIIDLGQQANLIIINRAGTYMPQINTIFINDGLSFSMMRNVLGHELVHFMRRAVLGEADWEWLDEKATLTDGITRKLDAALAFNEGCANFVGGAHLSHNKTSPLNLISDIYKAYFDGGWSYVVEMLPRAYRLAKKGVEKAEHSIIPHALGKMFHKDFGMHSVSDISYEFAVPEQRKNAYKDLTAPSYLYELGTDIATIIYASNGFDAEKSMKKMLVLPAEELAKELKNAVRPCVENAINQIAFLARQRRVSE